MSQQSQNVDRAITNYTLILVMVTEMVAAAGPAGSPTQADVQRVVNQAQLLGVVTPQPDSSVDGKSYSWSAYQEMIGRHLEQLMKVRAMLAGPYDVRSQAI
jgi:hypothetical protein